MTSVTTQTLTPVRLVHKERDLLAEAKLAQELNVPELIAALLVQRGYRDASEAYAFLNPTLDSLGDPKLLPDFAAARDAILGAKERGEKIYIHGDYDVDGVTSTAIFKRFLEKIGCNVHAHVPHRMKEGYGINMIAVEEAKTWGANLFLTCDCGSGALPQIEAAREAGMTVVVTDHHTMGAELPNAHALVNPHRPDSEYPFAELCGAGVVFRLCEGLAAELKLPIDKYRRAYLDLAVMGTVADVMPLVGENRTITHFGLPQLTETKKEGLRALIEVSEVLNRSRVKKLTAGHIGFQLAPRLNAAGRIDDAKRSLDLLLTTDAVQARTVATEIEAINRDRRAQQELMMAEAVERVEEMDWRSKYVIVLGQEGWHSGIVGLIAGRVSEQFSRPSFVMTYNAEAGTARGSARSYAGFHLADCIRAHESLMTGGGHAAAAGFSAALADVDAIDAALNAYASERLSLDDLVPSKVVDMAIEGQELTVRAVQCLESLEPFGLGNQTPLFSVEGATVTRVTTMTEGLHLKLGLRTADGSVFDAVAWGQGERAEEFPAGQTVDAVFKPEVNEFRGNVAVQMKLEHISPSAG